MALAFSEEQQMIQQSAQDFCSEQASVKELRRLREEVGLYAYDRQIWKQMCELGWGGLILPEKFGGSDLGVYELGIILIEAGRHLTPAPIMSTALLAALSILDFGSPEQQQEHLPKIATGERCFGFALDETHHYQPFHINATATKSSAGFLLSGSKTMVVDGMNADFFVVLAKNSNSPKLSLLVVSAEADQLTRKPLLTVDSRPAAHLTFNQVQLGADALLAELKPDDPALQRLLDVATIGAAAELHGVTEQAFQMTLNYLGERNQFGVPIGSFQALKHRMSDMFCEHQLARSTLLEALTRADQTDAEDLSAYASLCKAKIGTVARTITNESIQMHGGIGMTDEYDIGLFLKRSRVLENLFGNASWHRARYAKLQSY